MTSPREAGFAIYANAEVAHAALRDATTRRQEAEQSFLEARAVQSTAIRSAIAAGITRTEIARVAGLSRTAVYAIRDAK